MKITDYDLTNESSMYLFKGEPKTGKKRAWASFPEPIYALDTDLRMASIARCELVNKRNISWDSYTDYSDIYNRLEELLDSCPYKTVVLHSLTSLARITQDYIFDNRGASSEMSEVPSDKREKRNLKIGKIPIMGIADYNGESSGLANVMMKLRMIFNKHKCNVILVAHVIITDQPLLGGGSTTSRRIVTGGNKIAAEIPSYFNEVYHFEVDRGIIGEGILNSQPEKYIVNTRPTVSDFAGTSFQGIPSRINFTDKLFYDELMKWVNNPLQEIRL